LNINNFKGVVEDFDDFKSERQQKIDAWVVLKNTVKEMFGVVLSVNDVFPRAGSSVSSFLLNSKSAIHWSFLSLVLLEELESKKNINNYIPVGDAMQSWGDIKLGMEWLYDIIDIPNVSARKSSAYDVNIKNLICNMGPVLEILLKHSEPNKNSHWLNCFYQNLIISLVSNQVRISELHNYKLYKPLPGSLRQEVVYSDEAKSDIELTDKIIYNLLSCFPKDFKPFVATRRVNSVKSSEEKVPYRIMTPLDAIVNFVCDHAEDKLFSLPFASFEKIIDPYIKAAKKNNLLSPIFYILMKELNESAIKCDINDWVVGIDRILIESVIPENVGDSSCKSDCDVGNNKFTRYRL